MFTEGVHKEVLPNGLTLLVQPNDAAPVVAVVTRVRAGFFDEPDRWIGISHVLEHMFFKGTARRGVGQIARETKSAGGYLNASTSYDHTTYLTVLPASSFATALDIQADALRNSAIDAEELARELRVIIEEAKRKLDTPSAVTYETLHEVMFDHHRIRRWRIGREDHLARLTRDDLWGYYQSRYVPERTVVTITGAVTVEQALVMAHRTYGDWDGRPGAIDRSPEEPWRREVRARTLRGDVARAELALGWRTVPALHEDTPSLDVAAMILSTGRGSWLYRGLREPGIVTSVSAHNYTPTELGVFGIAASLAPEQMARAVQGMAEAVARLTLLGPSDDDVERARTLLRAQWARRLEPMEGRAGALAAAEMLGDVALLDREYHALITVTAEQVREAAARYLHPDAVSAVAYLPRDTGTDLTADAVGRAFAVTALTPVADGTVPMPAPAITRHEVHGAFEGDVLHVALDGVDLLLRAKRGVPLATVGIFMPRTHFDPPALAGLSALAVRSALRGAGNLDAAGLAFAMEQLGGTLSPSSTSDWLGFSTTVLADRLGSAAALLDLVLTQPRFDDASVGIERSLMTLEAEQVVDDMFRYPFQLAFRGAFGEHGYGLPISGLPHTLPAILPAAVRAWHERTLVDVRPVVVAVGDLTPQRAAEELAGIFRRYPARPANAVAEPSEWAVNGTPVAQVVDRDKAQSAIAIVFPGPARRDAARGPAEVWAAVASGLGGRLFEALREQRSLAYTVHASAWLRSRAGALVTYIATSPEREDEARATMLAELAGFASQPVSDAELRQGVSYLSGQTEVHRQSSAALAGEILEAWVTGVGLAELADPTLVYRNVSVTDVQKIGASYLDPTRMAEGVIRGRGGARLTLT